MKKPKYIGTAIFDIDGVLCNIEELFCINFGYERRDLYNFYERYPDKVGEIKEFISNPDSYWDSNAIFGGILLLNQARENGWYTVVMTSRPDHLGKVTEKWLDRYKINYDHLSYAVDKAELIKNMMNSKPMFLVDDALHHLKALPRGVTGIAWHQPWNIGHFPRATYHDRGMQVMKATAQGQPWTPFWRQ